MRVRSWKAWRKERQAIAKEALRGQRGFVKDVVGLGGGGEMRERRQDFSDSTRVMSGFLWSVVGEVELMVVGKGEVGVTSTG